MSEKRDFLDDIIDISDDFSAVKNPLSSLANEILNSTDDATVYSPSHYKETPRVFSNHCARQKTKNSTICSSCLENCPRDAIIFNNFSPMIDDSICNKCGICIGACKMDVFSAGSISPKKIYDRVSGAAASHNTCYVTCTRALGRIPNENEILLPCVADVSAEVWFALMMDFNNIAVYLPLGVCDKCKTRCGERMYLDKISTAEKWSGKALNLVTSEDELECDIKRSWKRKEFVDNISKSAQKLISKTNPVMSAAKRVNNMISSHTKKMNDLSRKLDVACGVRDNSNKKRHLSENRSILMAAIAEHVEVAKNIDLYSPVCDKSLCTLCGKCIQICPVNAMSISDDGRVITDREYCTQCGMCKCVCEDGALDFEFFDAEELILS